MAAVAALSAHSVAATLCRTAAVARAVAFAAIHRVASRRATTLRAVQTAASRGSEPRRGVDAAGVNHRRVAMMHVADAAAAVALRARDGTAARDPEAYGAQVHVVARHVAEADSVAAAAQDGAARKMRAGHGSTTAALAESSLEALELPHERTVPSSAAC